MATHPWTRVPTAPVAARLFDFVARHPSLSACQIAHESGIPCNTVSTTLKKMCDAGYLNRKAGDGPRGGHTYTAIIN